MHLSFLLSLVILVGLVVWTSAIPCAVKQQLGCFSCVRWLDVRPGQVFCKYRKGPNGRKKGKMQVSCQQIKTGNRICVEEKKGWSRCTRTRTVSQKMSLKDLGQARRENIELNDGVIKQTGDICVEGMYPKNCGLMVRSEGTKTCKAFRTNYRVKRVEFTRLNPGIICNRHTFLPRTSLCVRDAFCYYRHNVTERDTCAKLQRAFKISPEMFQKLNPEVECGNLIIGSRVCVWPKSNRRLPNMTCVDEKSIEQGDTCLTLTLKYGRPFDELLFLNPSMNCENLKPGRKMCTRGEASKVCARIVDVPPSVKCGELFATHALSPKMFFENNPLVQCHQLNQTQQICGGRGYFPAAQCSAYRMVKNDHTSIKSVIETAPFYVDDNSLTHKERMKEAKKRLVDYNRGLVGTKRKDLLMKGKLICTELAGVNRVQNMRKIVDALSSKAPKLSAALSNYENNPSLKTSNKFRNLFLRKVRKEDVYRLLMDLNRRNETIRRALEVPSVAGERKKICADYRKAAPNSDLTKCFCDNTQLYIHCYGLLGTAFLESARERPSFNVFARPSKAFHRFNPGDEEKPKTECSLNDFRDLLDFGSDPKSPTKAQCLGGSCSIPIHLAIYLKLSASICGDLWSMEHYHRQALELRKNNTAEVIVRQHEYAAKVSISNNFGVAFCVSPTKIIPLLPFLEACVNVLDLTYYPWKGTLNLGAEPGCWWHC